MTWSPEQAVECFERLQAQADGVARGFAARYGYPIEAADLAQEIMIRLLSGWPDPTSASRQEVNAAARRTADSYCRRERAAYLARTGQWRYSTDDVRALLPVFLASRDGWEAAPVPVGSEPVDPGAAASEPLAGMADMAIGWECLSADQRNALTGYDPTDVTARKRFSRAVQALAYHMNGG